MLPARTGALADDGQSCRLNSSERSEDGFKSRQDGSRRCTIVQDPSRHRLAVVGAGAALEDRARQITYKELGQIIQKVTPYGRRVRDSTLGHTLDVDKEEIRLYEENS